MLKTLALTVLHMVVLEYSEQRAQLAVISLRVHLGMRLRQDCRGDWDGRGQTHQQADSDSGQGDKRAVTVVTHQKGIILYLSFKLSPP